MASLAGEIRRIVAMMPGGGASPRTIQVWDSLGLEAPDTRSIAQQAGVSLESQAKRLDALTSGSADLVRRFAPALSLALAGAMPQAGTPDFLHPRLAAPKARRIGRREAWAIGIVAAVVLAIFVFWLDIRRRESNLAALNAEIARAKPKVQAAEKTAQLIAAARAWYPEGRPAMLDCAREIAEAFPDGGEAIYVTKFTLPETRVGQLLGRTPDQTFVFDLVDRLNKNKNFSNVKSNFMLNAGGNSDEIAFSISFMYQVPAAAAVAKGAK